MLISVKDHHTLVDEQHQIVSEGRNSKQMTHGGSGEAVNYKAPTWAATCSYKSQISLGRQNIDQK